MTQAASRPSPSVARTLAYTLLWILIPITISLGIVQEMCARMGAVTGKGLADLIRERFGVRWTAVVMLALLIANAVSPYREVCRYSAATELFGYPVSFGSTCRGDDWWLVVKGSI